MPGPGVHYKLTREWAEQEGMSAADAAKAAEADIAVDILWPGSDLWTRHFNPTARLFWVPLNFRLAVGRRSPGHLGFALHSLQDSFGHGLLGLSHLRYRFGMLKRQPDIWELMPDRTRRRIEATSRALIRAYVRRTGRRQS